MARELGIDDLRFVGSLGRGLGNPPLNYPAQLIRTVAVLLRCKPRIVFVQSPPTFAAWTVALYCAATGATFVIDAHSDAFGRARWTRPARLNRFVARQALVTIVTNSHWAARVRSWGAEAMTIPTIPTDLVVGKPPARKPGINVAVVNTWAADEPLDAFLAAGSRQAADPQGILDVLCHCLVRVQRVALEHHGDVTVAWLECGDIPWTDEHASARWLLEAGQKPERSCLAAP